MNMTALRAAIRVIRQDPGYAVAFVLTLGLGIGATTAIFSAVEGVLIRPLPYPHADRIVYAQQPLTHDRRSDATRCSRSPKSPTTARRRRPSTRSSSTATGSSTSSGSASRGSRTADW